MKNIGSLYILEAKKFTTYSDLLDDYCFVPIGIESFGTWGHEGHKLIKEIGKTKRSNW